MKGIAFEAGDDCRIQLFKRTRDADQLKFFDRQINTSKGLGFQDQVRQDVLRRFSVADGLDDGDEILHFHLKEVMDGV